MTASNSNDNNQQSNLESEPVTEEQPTTLRRSTCVRKQTEFIQPESVGRSHSEYTSRSTYNPNMNRHTERKQTSSGNINTTMPHLPNAYVFVASAQLGAKDT